MESKYSKRYPEEFKRDAVALVESSGRTVTEVARELGINPESLRGWVKKARNAKAPSTRPAADGVLDAAEREELRRLRKLAAEQAMTIEILKKRRPSSRGRATGECNMPVDPRGEGPLSDRPDVPGPADRPLLVLRLGRR
ncbi:hypothetical protein SHKM778_24380 [Streptomyces sp. KM77-8]|uniref:Transposase n=1 Tax=Streptomyces haneummycinicus TaxID=3074435 RepID=A0AAT9HFV6_9ACTN